MDNYRRRVVVSGLGCVSSLGCEIETLWQNLLAQKSGIARITRFDPTGYYCQIAGEIRNFDPLPCIPQRDIARLDLFSQYGILATHHAIRSAGLRLEQEDRSRIGVVMGCGMGGMTDIETNEETIRQKGPGRISPFFIPKVMINAVAGEISIRYGLEGPAFVVASACASSAQAIFCALRSIQYGETDAMIAGGAEAIITPLTIAGFCASRALSHRNEQPEKASRPFDNERDGFVMGEGAAVLVLEEMEHAKKRGATIYAELLGAAANADAYHITLPDPGVKNIAKVMDMALRDSRLNATDIGYINAHGTSTKPNDRAETLAIKKVFGDYARKIPISSSKSLLGHLIGASGAIEAVITVLTISRNQVHATANYEFPDPECDLDYVPRQARETTVNYAMSNSFGFGGHNACLVFGKAT
jgi:3-oxoacyl-[acyl-carrier-protein] synthase II